MEEKSEQSSTGTDSIAVPESPRPTAFTIGFDNEKKVDTQRQKTLAEKFQLRHKRGKSMSKLEDSSSTPTLGATKKHPLTGNLPRKSSFQSEGYFSSDEKPERSKSAKTPVKRSDLTLFLKNVTTDRMTQSFPNAALPSIASPEGCELQNVSSPEFESISPFSPNIAEDLSQNVQNISLSSEEVDEEVFTKGTDFDFDKKSDTVSETGTYTLDVENYSEEQKAKMSIDNEFKIEQVSVQRKTEEYIRSLSAHKAFIDDPLPPVPPISCSSPIRKGAPKTFIEDPVPAIPPLKNPDFNIINGKSKPVGASFKSPSTPPVIKSVVLPSKVLSPILSPTQNISIVGNKSLVSTNAEDNILNQTFTNKDDSLFNNTFTKTMFPSPKSQPTKAKATDEGAIISVTSSGAFRSKIEEKKKLQRKLSLTKSEVHIEAYVDGKSYNEKKLNNSAINPSAKRTSNLTANIVNVQSIEVTPGCTGDSGGVVSASLVFGKMGNVATVTTGLPPTPTGKTSPSKIPSPIHTLSRPRSRNSFTSPSDDLDTELILKPTQNYINSLQHKLSLDSDQDSDYEMKYGLQLNNTAHLMKQKASHIRHNSLDDRTLNNKLEHFQNKNLQTIDQTYSNLLNQYRPNKVVNKINNSPSNSPIRRSSSFSNRNQINNTKSTNISSYQKDSNLCNSPNFGKNNSIQRSSSTACIKPNYVTNRRSSTSEHKKIDRSQFGDTESSSEEDVDKTLQKRKDLGNISNTRCNRTFSLRRARLDNEQPTKLKCPNTPEMRRKSFQPVEHKPERAISVDRKPVKTNEVQSRYLLNISKRGTPPPAPKEIAKTVPKPHSAPPVKNPAKPSTPFSRTEGGRFSMRAQKLPTSNVPAKSAKKDGKNAKQSSGGRSNSSLSSREVEFQNWKRRKSYDPMKAAAEGKRKEMQKRLSGMTGSYTDATGRTGAVSPDSSPSHSGSVHRSQVSPLLINMVPGDFSDC